MAGAGTGGPRRQRPDWGHTPDAPAPTSRGPKPPKPAKPAKPPAAKRPAARSATPKPASAPPRSRKAATARTAAKPSKASTSTKTATSRKAATARSAPKAKRGSTSRRFQARYAIRYDTDGPRVRLGIAWFVLALAAVLAGALPTALVYGTAAAVAAAQMARCWRKRGARPSDTLAAGGAALIAAGSSFGAGVAGLGIFGAVALAFVAAAGDPTSPNPRIADIGWTVQCALAPGIVAMSMVLITRLDRGSGVALLLLVSAYETGDYLIGSGANNPYEGPAAGGAGIVVVTFIVSTLPVSTLSFGEAWLLGGAVALLAPAGQLLGSALLPAADAPASAVRRLDSLLLCAPLWAWGVGLAASS